MKSMKLSYILAAAVAVIALFLLFFWERPAPDRTPDPDGPHEPGDPDPNPDPDPTPDPDPAPPVDSAGIEVSFGDPGDLVEESGTGLELDLNFAPGMRFPVERPRAFANSQVYGVGGLHGPAGGQCDARNYSYPWRDNFCETRGYATPMCPAGTGHQGQDIRPPHCPPAQPDDQRTFYAVATFDGQITGLHRHVMTLTDTVGRQYKYLHLDPNQYEVALGDLVSRGQRLGVISNYFGDTPTTYHLHFEMRQSVELGGAYVMTPVSPYVALREAYLRLIEGDEDA
ncbi:M23 family metallopeptidase [Woodsholea maritima]|uniref:M23 family metallopeptidase n=1 Tax=Woodsholea maritima TaxID=240237 RepID=UPI0003813C6D|nr:M23 family metallopeptidase [Woodsholea maritima]